MNSICAPPYRMSLFWPLFARGVRSPLNNGMLVQTVRHFMGMKWEKGCISRLKTHLQMGQKVR